MQISPIQRASERKKLLWFGALLVIVSGTIASYLLLTAPRTNPAWKYRFPRPAVGSITKNIQQEIAFHQRIIQQQPTAGLARAALAQNYLKMARATGDSSWYLLAQQTAQQSLNQLPFYNYGAILVLAKVSAAKHDFTQSLALVKQLPPQAESLSLSTTNYLALGNANAARVAADTAVRRMPSLSNFALRALVEVAQGQDAAAIKDFKTAIAAEEPDEAGSSAWVRTLLGRFYYKRGQLQQAEELYDSALQILPKYPPALLNLAELSVRRWQADPTQPQHQRRAVELYDRFFLTNNQQNPTVHDHVALRGLARVQRLQGKIAQANQTWEQAVSRLRSDLTGFGHRRELAQLLLEWGQRADRAEALALMQAEIKIRQDPETWDTLAAAYLQTGQLERAQQAISAALKLGIRDPGLLDRAAVIAQARGQSAQAQKYREVVKSIDPTFDAGARQALGLGVGLSGLN
ncbi:tetratricopeptide repeat protein [Chamaesiphon minutus]|uniref:Tetratricopeptide repeat protein n=1 Tax=Chamaesiphon minutus (strain ATCC 27169 / PCC 6605) TaxID=1173020 RepID=K9UJZ0_CHAP6|nr:tetratricopeptide repeat protein [Chamaesiphon minutus]AFY94978.1 tetratricopeptide repeat protein [Chamaesiphon minutus PCC 6605]